VAVPVIHCLILPVGCDLEAPTSALNPTVVESARVRPGATVRNLDLGRALKNFDIYWTYIRFSKCSEAVKPNSAALAATEPSFRSA